MIKILKESYNHETFENKIEDINFKSGKSPKGMKDIYTSIVRIGDLYKRSKEFGKDKSKMFFDQINTELKRHTDKEWDDIIDKLKGKSEELILELKNATYINESSISFNNFKKISQDLDSFLNSLKDFHKKALLVKPLSIYFVKANEMKSKAKYVTQKDVFYIRPDLVIKDKAKENEYASFNYIMVHELGHRYLRYFNVKTNFNNSIWYTTPYSKKDSWTEEETFAELFALSHWINKYPQYKDTLNKFIKEIG